MAGVGFELKKLFSPEEQAEQNGLFATLCAYGYAGTLCAGPLLLGILLQAGVLFLADRAGLARTGQELLVCMITYTLLASLLTTSVVSMPLTRFWADALYEGRPQAVPAAFRGANALLLPVGCLWYGAFLLVSGANLVQGLLCLWLFAEMIVNWNAISCLTALGQHGTILRAFLVALAGAWLLSSGVLWLGIKAPAAEPFLFAVGLGYGLMLVQNMVQLHRLFPQNGGSLWEFLRWMDKYRPLVWTGLWMNVGLFGHLVLLWAGPIGVQVKGLFYAAPFYDVAAMLAFLSVLLTTVNFVIAVEVNFYPVYRDYSGLFNQGGTIGEITLAEKRMLAILNRELWYTALKQLFFTAALLSLESTVLDALPLGFNDMMHGYFRTLCVGYGLYAVGNTALLILLYFTDDKGALHTAAVFAAASTGLTALSPWLDPAYYGFGFLLGAAAFCLAAFLRLDAFTAELPYHILGHQPLTVVPEHGFFTRLALWLERPARQSRPNGKRTGRHHDAKH